MTTELPEITSLQRLAIGPDDVLIITTPARLSAQQADDLKRRVREVLHTDRILVVSDGARVDVAELPAEDRP